jgi:hypothetical protein
MADIQHTIESNATLAEAYAAAAEESGIQAWWTDRARVGDEVGAPVHLQFEKGDMIVDMAFVIETLEPNRRVVWRCTENVNPVWPGTRIEWLVEEQSEGTRLTLTHSGFSEAGSPPYQMTVEGWPMFVERLREHLG